MEMRMKAEAVERAIKLLEAGRVVDEPLSVKDADAILASLMSLSDLIADDAVNVPGLLLFIEVGMARIGAEMGSATLPEMLRRLQREERAATLAKVAPEPIQLWGSTIIKRAEQILGRETLAEVARQSYLEALRAGWPAADQIRQRFNDLLDDEGVLRAKYDGVEKAFEGRASSTKLAFLSARVADATLDASRFKAWARDQYLIAMYGRSARTNLAAALAAHVDVDSISEQEMARGWARDLLIEPTKIEREDLEVIDEAVTNGSISKVERDEALRIAMFHRFEQGAEGDRTAVELELALGFVEWSQPGLRQARRRGVELELSRLAEGKISAEQMDFFEASMVRGLLLREELDPLRTRIYLELKWGPDAKPEAAENMRRSSDDAVWLDRLPEKKPCFVGDVDIGARLRQALGSEASLFAPIADAIVDALPLFADPSQVRAAFDALVATLDHDRLRTFPKEVVRIALWRARSIIDYRPSRRRRSSMPRMSSTPRKATYRVMDAYQATQPIVTKNQNS
jgi:hypothetical protein